MVAWARQQEVIYVIYVSTLLLLKHLTQEVAGVHIGFVSLVG
jgi:hypothetical protein